MLPAQVQSNRSLPISQLFNNPQNQSYPIISPTNSNPKLHWILLTQNSSSFSPSRFDLVKEAPIESSLNPLSNGSWIGWYQVWRVVEKTLGRYRGRDGRYGVSRWGYDKVRMSQGCDEMFQSRSMKGCSMEYSRPEVRESLPESRSMKGCSMELHSRPEVRESLSTASITGL